MTFPGLTDDDARFPTANELHARPFPSIEGSGFALCLALRDPATERVDTAKSEARLVRLLDRYGVALPAEGANHYFGQIGRYRLKWERHTEFETYTIFSDVAPETPFALGDVPFPEEWCRSVEARVLTAVLVQIEKLPDGVNIADGVPDWVRAHLVPESTCVSVVLDGAALVASDFTIDEAGFVRMLVRARDDTGPQRLGRITQRLIEIETYKCMAMLTLPVARKVGGTLAEVDTRLAGIVGGFAEGGETGKERFDELVALSGQIEDLSARWESRFSAARAYGTIVNQRTQVLREERLNARQTVGEFMMRRFEPAMRTCESVENRLAATALRASRAAQLLRTRADVAREEQNQEVLARMDARAALQLKLQKTVEGLSVVAISYYAVNLTSYALYPAAKLIGMDKTMLTAVLVLPVLLGVWLIVRRIRKSL